MCNDTENLIRKKVDDGLQAYFSIINKNIEEVIQTHSDALQDKKVDSEQQKRLDQKLEQLKMTLGLTLDQFRHAEDQMALALHGGIISADVEMASGQKRKLSLEPGVKGEKELDALEDQVCEAQEMQEKKDDEEEEEEEKRPIKRSRVGEKDD